MKPKELAALLGLAAVWGASFLFIKVAVASPEHPLNFTPLTLVTIRLGLAGLVLGSVVAARRLRFPWERWRAFAVLGLINAAFPFFLFSWGEQRIDSNLAAIYNATTPLWTVALAWGFVREERLSRVRSLGIVIGFIGVVYLFAGNIGHSDLLGQIACIVAGMSYALGNMWARRRLSGIPSVLLAAGQISFGTLWVLPLSLIIEHPWTLRPSLLATGSLALLSLFGTATAMLIYFWLLGRVGATRTAQVTYLLPIFGLAWGRLIGEPVTSRIAGALVLILLGSIVVNGALDRLVANWSSRHQSA